nr:alpha-glucosidase [Ktedonobacterales bacterium]
GLGRDADGRLCWDVALANDECVFGGGQRTGPVDKRGRRLTLWSNDPLPNHNAATTDAMYQSASVFPILRAGQAHGIFFDHAHRATCDIGKAQADTLTFTTEGPDLVAYVYAGPDLASVLRQHTDLTGRMPPQPRWSLGNQQSRWSYMSADEVRAVAARFRAERIPCDAIYLDIDYMRGYRDFTFDPERFPDPAQLLADLRAQGMRVVPIIDPGVKVDPDYSVYQEGMQAGHFVHNPDGSAFEGWVWPGLSVWTDFASAAARAWWAAQHHTLLDLGVAGIWDDMNEPSQAGMSAPPEVTVPFGATLPDDTTHQSDEYGPLAHAAFHNAYGHEMVRATRESLEAARPDERAFVLTRAAQAGTQRYAIVWNGDSTSQWAHVAMAISMNLGVGLSGFPVTGIDIGGFWQDTTPELLTRFEQLGAFLPFCRNHSSQGTARQEPWVFGEPYTSAIRAAIEERYRLLPYLATLFHEASATGAPIMRPLAWLAPADAAAVACDDQFLLGSDLLVAPVLAEGATEHTVLLPPGDWLAWQGDAAYAGGQRITLPVTLTTIPLFQRAGSIIPTTGVTQHTDEAPAEPLTLVAALGAPGQTAAATIWDDDDHPQAEARGTYLALHATATWAGDTITVQIAATGGQMAPRYPGLRVTVRYPQGGQVVSQTIDADFAALPQTLPFKVA